MVKQITVFSLVLIIAVSAHAQTVDEIITKYIAFTGGPAAWKKIKTLTSSGTYNYGGLKFPFQAFSKAPDHYRYKVSNNSGSFEQAYDGTKGWRIDRFKKETKKTILQGKAARAMANEMDVELESLFINYNSKGHQLTLAGMDTVNGHMCYKIDLVRKDGDSASYFFDSINSSLVKKQVRSKNSELQNSLLDIFYTDYQPTAGVKFPHTILCRANGQDILIITVKSIKANLAIADASFQP